eukprot:TRINITY_DN31540_c0_g1_i1.p1 TRINITY_DN31540_c0_g1~~TRINITY_DN31540_c0_g1_i1.p1  ORF type:complete len:425 (+),score=20.91 TRINITY_DN31540_c0_g1_i1:1-1275(+)
MSRRPDLDLVSVLGIKPLTFLGATSRFFRRSGCMNDLLCPACEGRCGASVPYLFRYCVARCCNQSFCACTWPRCPGCGSNLNDSDLQSLTSYQDPRDLNGPIQGKTSTCESMVTDTHAVSTQQCNGLNSVEGSVLQTAAVMCAWCGDEDNDGWPSKDAYYCARCWDDWWRNWSLNRARTHAARSQRPVLIYDKVELDLLYRQHSVTEGVSVPVRFENLDSVCVGNRYETRVSVERACSLEVGKAHQHARACILSMGAWYPLDPGNQRSQLGTISHSTTLLSVLRQAPDSHRLQSRWGGYYVPKVLVQRDREGHDLQQAYVVAMVHATAPVYNPDALPVFMEELRLKVFNVFRMCLQHDHDTLILGAWGCGGRGAPPHLVAQVFLEVLGSSEMLGQFKAVVFAVLGKSEYEIFDALLTSSPVGAS